MSSCIHGGGIVQDIYFRYFGRLFSPLACCWAAAFRKASPKFSSLPKFKNSRNFYFVHLRIFSLALITQALVACRSDAVIVHSAEVQRELSVPAEGAANCGQGDWIYITMQNGQKYDFGVCKVTPELLEVCPENLKSVKGHKNFLLKDIATIERRGRFTGPCNIPGLAPLNIRM